MSLAEIGATLRAALDILTQARALHPSGLYRGSFDLRGGCPDVAPTERVVRCRCG